jgi:hypothetical protein
MMNRALLLGFCLTILFWPSKVAVPRPSPPDLYPVSSTFNLDYKQLVVARRVEKRLRKYGFSDELIAGALVNAYAESGLDIDAVGKAGERGIFQLNPRGLGHGMTVNEMQDVSLSVDRIANAVLKNNRVMELERKGGSVAQHALIFCKEIERPSHKDRKARERVRLIEKIMID